MTSLVPATCDRLAQELADYGQLPTGVSIDRVTNVCNTKLYCDPTTVSQDQCIKIARQNVQSWFAAPPSSSSQEIKKPDVSLIEGDRDRSTITDCDQQFIDAKITEEEWKQLCFKSGTWNFERRDRLIKELEDRKTFEKSDTLWGQFQFRLGPEVVRRHSVFKGAFAAWNKAAASGVSGYSETGSDDAMLDRGLRVGGRIAITTEPGLTRLSQDSSVLSKITVLDASFYDANVVLVPKDSLYGNRGYEERGDKLVVNSADNNRLSLGLFDFLFPVAEKNFASVGFSFIDEDYLWWKNSNPFAILPRNIRVGLDWQFSGIAVKTSEGTKAVFSLDPMLSNYDMLGLRADYAYISVYDGGKSLEMCRIASREETCQVKDSLNLNDEASNAATYLPGVIAQDGLGFAKSESIISRSLHQIRLTAHVHGEHRNIKSGLAYRGFVDLYPQWSMGEAGVLLSGHLNHNMFRFMAQGFGRRVWSYGEHDMMLPNEGYEYGAQLMLGFIPSKF